MAAGPSLIRLLALVIRAAISGVFLYAGIAKAIDPNTFAQQIDNYRLVSHPTSAAIALYLPWLEIICGIALWTKRLERGAIAVLCCLTCVFLLARLSAWSRGIDISCGCFGSTAHSTPVADSIVIDGAILIGLLVLSRNPLQ